MLYAYSDCNQWYQGANCVGPKNMHVFVAGFCHDHMTVSWGKLFSDQYKLYHNLIDLMRSFGNDEYSKKSWGADLIGFAHLSGLPQNVAILGNDGFRNGRFLPIGFSVRQP